MNNRKSTKKALLSSVLCLLLCCSMLIGTTFAWFTDEVVSGKNHIVAGNLDVELEYFNGTEWVSVNENTNVFEENTLWEPGHTEVVYLKISNKGTLALNYTLGVNIVSETKSVNVFDKELVLSDHIKMGVAEGNEHTVYADRDAAIAAATTLGTVGEGYTSNGYLLPETSTYVNLVVYMPTTVGNEANYKTGAAIPEILLGINLYATQRTHEKDSWDNQYDAGANVAVPTVPVTPYTITATVYDVFDTNEPQTTLTDLELDIYEFIAANFQGAYPVEEYKEWTCDFFVSTDSAVDEGLILVGNYATYGWLGFWVPASTEAYAPTGLLGVVTSGGESNWTYEGICNDVQIFRCGLIDYYGNNEGVEVTVELRMTSPDKTQTITVCSITVTL